MSAEVVGARRGNVRITNRLFFNDSSWLKVRYEVTVEGVVKARGVLKVSAIKPQATANIQLPVDWQAPTFCAICFWKRRRTLSRAVGSARCLN